MAAVQETARLLGLVVDTQNKLAELETTAKGVVDELANSGPGATPRLRELLTTGDKLVAAVQAATAELAPRMPPSGTLPAAPSRAAVEAVWAREHAPAQQAAALPSPVPHPAASLQGLAASLQALPGGSLQLLRGRRPAAAAAEATAVVLRCGRAFSAVVHLQGPGGLRPLRVGVLSAAETDSALSHAASEPSTMLGHASSLWAPSQHSVFQQLSVHAAAAMDHFLGRAQAQAPPGAQQQQGGEAASPLELLLLWLATCGDLFAQRHTGGGGARGGLMLADTAAAGVGLALPLRRPWGLSWGDLWAAALNPHLRRAEPAAASGTPS